jgi:hypothetical protein
MVPTDAVKKILSIAASEIDSNLIINLGYLRSEERISHKGKTAVLNSEFYSNELIVTFALNYQVLAQYIDVVHCHGGCGTMLAFKRRNVKVLIHPVDHDQFFNAKWNEEYNEPLDEDDNETLNLFTTNVRKFFGLKTIFRSAPLPLNFAPVVKKEVATDLSYSGALFPCSYDVVDEIYVTHDCVKVAICKQIVFRADRETFEVNYSNFTALKTITTQSDILYVCMLSKLSIDIVDQSTNYCRRLICNGLAPRVCIMVTREVNHAVIVKLTDCYELDETVQTESHIMALREGDTMYRTELFAELFEVLARDKPKTSILSSSDVRTITNGKRVDITNRLSVIVRQSETSYTPTVAHTQLACRVKNVRLAPNYTWKLITNKGVINAISFQDQLRKETWWYHGVSGVSSVIWAMRVNKVNVFSLTSVVQSATTSEITAINQTTKRECNKLNIPVQTVGSLNAKHLYIYNTWNRPHHLEKERDCIKSAKNILLVGRTISDAAVEHLKKTTIPRLIIRKNILSWVIETSKDMVKREVAERALRMLLGWRSIHNNLWVHEYDTDCLYVQTLFEFEDNDEKTAMVYKEFDVSLAEPIDTTLGALVDLVKCEAPWSIVTSINDDMKTDFTDVDEISLKLDKSPRPISTLEWKEMIATGYLYKNRTLYVRANALTYGVLKSGGAIKTESQFWTDYGDVEYYARSEDKFGVISKRTLTSDKQLQK